MPIKLLLWIPKFIYEIDPWGLITLHGGVKKKLITFSALHKKCDSFSKLEVLLQKSVTRYTHYLENKDTIICYLSNAILIPYKNQYLGTFIGQWPCASGTTSLSWIHVTWHTCFPTYMFPDIHFSRITVIQIHIYHPCHYTKVPLGPGTGIPPSGNMWFGIKMW